MKRSRKIRLVLIGGLTAGALAGCGPDRSQTKPISPNNVYTNNFYLPGVGYYHAPFRAWYPHPYNFYDSQNQRYFQGGQWAVAPYESIINISSPTPEAARIAEAKRADIQRGGFGETSWGHSSIYC